METYQSQKLLGGCESENDHKLIISSYLLAAQCTKYVADGVPMAINVKVMVLWVVVLYSLVDSFLQNSGTSIPKYTASHPESPGSQSNITSRNSIVTISICFCLYLENNCMLFLHHNYVNKQPTRCNCTQFILSINCSSCFGWFLHPSSGAQITVTAAWD